MPPPPGNPTWLGWIREESERLKEKNYKSWESYKRAAATLKTCPVPYTNPRDLLSLKYVGIGIVKFLEKKQKTLDGGDDDPPPAPAPRPRKRKAANNNNEDDDDSNRPPGQRAKGKGKKKPYDSDDDGDGPKKKRKKVIINDGLSAKERRRRAMGDDTEEDEEGNGQNKGVGTSKSGGAKTGKGKATAKGKGKSKSSDDDDDDDDDPITYLPKPLSAPFSILISLYSFLDSNNYSSQFINYRSKEEIIQGAKEWCEGKSFEASKITTTSSTSTNRNGKKATGAGIAGIAESSTAWKGISILLSKTYVLQLSLPSSSKEEFYAFTPLGYKAARKLVVNMQNDGIPNGREGEAKIPDVLPQLNEAQLKAAKGGAYAAAADVRDKLKGGQKTSSGSGGTLSKTNSANAIVGGNGNGNGSGSGSGVGKSAFQKPSGSGSMAKSATQVSRISQPKAKEKAKVSRGSEGGFDEENNKEGEKEDQDDIEEEPFLFWYLSESGLRVNSRDLAEVILDDSFKSLFRIEFLTRQLTHSFCRASVSYVTLLERTDPRAEGDPPTKCGFIKGKAAGKVCPTFDSLKKKDEKGKGKEKETEFEMMHIENDDGDGDEITPIDTEIEMEEVEIQQVLPTPASLSPQSDLYEDQIAPIDQLALAPEPAPPQTFVDDSASLSRRGSSPMSASDSTLSTLTSVTVPNKKKRPVLDCTNPSSDDLHVQPPIIKKRKKAHDSETQKMINKLTGDLPKTKKKDPNEMYLPPAGTAVSASTSTFAASSSGSGMVAPLLAKSKTSSGLPTVTATVPSDAKSPRDEMRSKVANAAIGRLSGLKRSFSGPATQDRRRSSSMRSSSPVAGPSTDQISSQPTTSVPARNVPINPLGRTTSSSRSIIPDFRPAPRKSFVPTSFTPLILPAGTFNVKLIVDSRERGFAETLMRMGVEVESRALEVGDCLWVAKRKVLTGREDDEVVLNSVLERKRLDDLVSSIQGGRFTEQKARMQRSGITNRVYLIECYKLSQNMKDYDQQIWTAKTQVQVTDSFHCVWTKSIEETLHYLVDRTDILREKYLDRDLYVIPPHMIDRAHHLDLMSHLRRQHPSITYHTSFQAFQSLNDKSYTLLRTAWASGIYSVKGLSAEKVVPFIERWETPKAFWEDMKQERVRWEEQEAAAEEEHQDDSADDEDGKKKKKRPRKKKGGGPNFVSEQVKSEQRAIGLALSEKIWTLWTHDGDKYPKEWPTVGSSK